MDSEFDPLAPPRRVHQSDSDSDTEDGNVSIISSPPEVSLEGVEDPNQANVPAGTEEITKQQTQETAEETPGSSKLTARKLSATPSERPAAEEDRAFDFQHFLDQMRSKPADPIARYVKSFLSEFLKKNWTATEQVKIVTDFESFIAARMRECPPFSSLEQRDWENAQEGVEKLIMNRLYSRTFSPKMLPHLRRADHEEDLLRDKVLSERLRLWDWIEPRHLDIPVQCFENKSFSALACKQIAKINSYRAPRDKCICVLNCSKVVWALIRSANIEGNADSFLPILIYIILQAKPTFLISNINYIDRFRGASHMRGETAYYLSMIQSAVAFIEAMDKKSLTIEDQEYQEKVVEAVRLEKQRPESQRLDDLDGDAQHVSSSSVLSASAGLLVESLKSYANKIFEPDEVDVATPPPSATPAGTHTSRTVNPEELAAKQASAEEYRARQAQEKEFEQTLETLTQMFPTLDKEVIEDVLREKGTRIGAAIDVCLSLCE